MAAVTPDVKNPQNTNLKQMKYQKLAKQIIKNTQTNKLKHLFNNYFISNNSSKLKNIDKRNSQGQFHTVSVDQLSG